MANEFNQSGGQFTGNGTYPFNPPPEAEAEEFLVTFQWVAGSATVSIQQRGSSFTDLDAVAVSSAATQPRKAIVASCRAPVNLVIASASSLQANCFIERLTRKPA